MAKSTRASDGNDYMHRQRILPHYQTLVLCKKRLKFVTVLHLMLNCLMAFKLLPTVLDMLNIFVQPIEELYIPMARPWEWVWFSSILIALFSFRACKTNKSSHMKLYLFGTFLTCILPIVYAFYYYAMDFRHYVITRDALSTSETWKGYPVALFWYIFITVAIQIHGFELFFGFELLKSMNNQRVSHNKSK